MHSSMQYRFFQNELQCQWRIDRCHALTWACWARRHSKVESLLQGTLSHVATLCRATRALASYHRTDGSLACPCFAAFCFSLPACNDVPTSPLSALAASYVVWLCGRLDTSDVGRLRMQAHACTDTIKAQACKTGKGLPRSQKQMGRAGHL